MEHLFEFDYVDSSGRKGRAVARAASEAEILARESRRGSRVTALARVRPERAGRSAVARRRDQISLLRQLSVMVEARIDVSEAMSAMQAGASSPLLRSALGDGLARLRGGYSLADCLPVAIPGLADSTLALIRAGEAGGCLAETLAHAVRRLEAEERVAAAMRSALVYPLFLVVAGLVAGLTMLTLVIPQFGAILGERAENLSGLSAVIFGLGTFASDTYGLGILLPMLAAGALLTLLFTHPAARQRLRLSDRIPGLRELLVERERERWCRLMAFALSARIGIVEAMQLAGAGLSPGGARDRLVEALRELRMGARVMIAVETLGLLDHTQLSLVRAGEETGTLAEMFLSIASDSEVRVHEAIKRATVVLEQMVLAGVSIFVGLIVYALMSSLTSVYETIGQ